MYKYVITLLPSSTEIIIGIVIIVFIIIAIINLH